MGGQRATRASSAVPRGTLTYFPSWLSSLSHCPNGQEEQPHSHGRGIRCGALSGEEEQEEEEEEEESDLTDRVSGLASSAS